MQIVIKYTFFAILSTLLNISVQFVSFHLYYGFGSLFVGMFWGTLAGLFLKYYLDKHYIFYHIHTSHVENGKTFLLYSSMGLITTALSWSIEYSFDTLWQVEYSKYIGAIIGQILGYTTKYQLDKRFVFDKNRLDAV